MHDTLEADIGDAHFDVFQTFSVTLGFISKNVLFHHNVVISYMDALMVGEQTPPTVSHNWLYANNILLNQYLQSGYNVIVTGSTDVQFENNTCINSGAYEIYSPYTNTPSLNSSIKNGIFYHYSAPQHYTAYAFHQPVGLGPSYNHDGCFEEYNLWTSYDNGSINDNGDTFSVTDLLGIDDPGFVNRFNPIGADGKFWTADDGLRLKSDSVAKTASRTGKEIGAYSDFDYTAPSITAFTLPVSSNGLTFSISSLVCSDNIGITGWLIQEDNATEPAFTRPGWLSSVPTTITATSIGNHTFSVFAKDAVGNIGHSTANTAIQITIGNRLSIPSQRQSATRSKVSSGYVLTTNDLIFRSKLGSASILIYNQNPGPMTPVITTVGHDVEVDGAGSLTANDVLTLINTDPSASQVMGVSLASGSTGSDIIGNIPKTNLEYIGRP
jgi:hypothetical protein